MKFLFNKKAISTIFCLFLVVLILVLTYTFYPKALNKTNSTLKYEKSTSISEEKKVRLTFMNWDSSEKSTRQNLDRALKEFGTEHQDIEIVNITVPLYEYQEQLIKQTSDGDDPDIIQLDGNWASLLGNKGVLEPLDDYGVKDKSEFDFLTDEVLETCKYKNTIYSIPFCLNAYGLWYNKNLLNKVNIKEPPKSIEELILNLKKIKAELPFIDKPKPVDVYGIGLDLTRNENAFTINWPIFLSFGVRDPLSSYWDTDANKARTKKALDWFKLVTREKYSPEGVRTNILREMMANEQIAYKIDGPGLRGAIQSINPAFNGNLFDRTFGVIPMPASVGSGKSSLLNTYSLGISRRSKNKEKALEFLKYMLKDKRLVQNYAIPSGYIPSLTSTINNNAVELNYASSHVYINDILPTAEKITYGPRFSESALVFMDGLQKITSGANTDSTLNEMNAILGQITDQ